jgi:hypothetical protein
MHTAQPNVKPAHTWFHSGFAVLLTVYGFKINWPQQSPQLLIECISIARSKPPISTAPYPAYLQAISMVLDVLCNHQLITPKGHAQHRCACGQSLIRCCMAPMAQEALDSCMAQHSSLRHPGCNQHVAGLAALREVPLALLQLVRQRSELSAVS